MEQVFLARHGETEWNRIRRRQGQLNSPLTRGALAQPSGVYSRAPGRSTKNPDRDKEADGKQRNSD